MKFTISRNLLFFLLIIFLSCSKRITSISADAIYYNGNIFTMEDSMPQASVLVVKNGIIADVGDSTLLEKYTCKPDHLFNLNQQFVLPGFIDAHCHFYGYAKTSLSCNLTGTKSWEEVLLKLDSFSKTHTSFWITGRGWDQNDWKVKMFPDNEKLNQMFPDRPVIIKRVDGHAAICNKKALELSGINNHTQINGGEIVKLKNSLTGVLIDNAVDLVEKVILPPSQNEIILALKKAEAECYSLGLTTLADAGLDLETCLFLDSLENNKVLSMYLYLMLNPTTNGLKYAQKNGIYETDNLKICSFKLYADGALGSRGAKLKKDYCDRPGHSGMLLNSIEYFDQWCNDIKNTTNYQVNTHCIGDSANKLLLEIYGKYLKAGNDDRWRIEHAQVIDPIDFFYFKKYNIIPSVQPTHATSDGPWVEERLCNSRIKGAYAYKTLLKLNNYIPLGTDFPVESLNPLYTFYSAVYRENGNIPTQLPFHISESLTPLEALKGMTIWAARACRLENRKGSLRIGKDADFIVLDYNLLAIDKKDVLKTKVSNTYRNGVLVH